MAVRKVLLYPDHFLRRVAREVTSLGEDLFRAIHDLTDTMHSLPHCIGIAATQIGIDQRVLVMDTSHKDKSSHGLVALINPVVQKKEGTTYTKEGCLSLPNFLGRVERAEKITVLARAPEGKEKTWSFSGLEAICFQHELDHLDGILFIDRLNSLRADLYLRA